jgi:hypothetical protein
MSEEKAAEANIYETPETDLSIDKNQTIESFGGEVDSVLDQATEGAWFQSPIDQLRKLGYVEGAIIKRSAPDILPGVYRYGIFTGEFSVDEYKNIMLKFTDTMISHVAHCELITDVDKSLFQYIKEEKNRLFLKQEHFFQLINENMNDVIYGKDKN